MPITLSEARALYDSGAPVAHVAAALELDARAFLRLRRQHDWPLRPSPIRNAAKAKRAGAKRADASAPAQAAPAVSPADVYLTLDDVTPADRSAGEAATHTVDIGALRRQLANATQSELATVQKTLASGKPEDIERNARLLASLVKTLAELRRLEALDPQCGAKPLAVEGMDDEPPPRDLETLRDELARALERMSGESGTPDAGE
jgi:hypothetical protein